MAAGDLCAGNRKLLHKGKALTSGRAVENLQDLPGSNLSGANSQGCRNGQYRNEMIK